MSGLALLLDRLLADGSCRVGGAGLVTLDLSWLLGWLGFICGLVGLVERDKGLVVDGEVTCCLPLSVGGLGWWLDLLHAEVIFSRLRLASCVTAISEVVESPPDLLSSNERGCLLKYSVVSGGMVLP